MRKSEQRLTLSSTDAVDEVPLHPYPMSRKAFAGYVAASFTTMLTGSRAS
jgi:hypothetical protein